ncbi:MAG TPA: FAD-dependent oxidoreductase [Candidatus Eremiobacteraceae bacterium]|nr:FAD-dependent oxidoreductase [Candidatus Eremiobacteraceae bacterium]
MTAQSVDAIVIGSGQGGVPFAVDLANQGKKVVLFERGRLGGSCVNYGCTPSKAFLAAAHNAGRARRAAVLGVHAQVTIDFPAVMERVRSVRDEWTAGVGEKLDKAGVSVVHAQASFSAERTVEGGGQRFQAPLVVIDTGSTAFIPPTPGLAGTPFLTNENFFELRQLPKRFLVMGGGYIGLELGQGMARLGSQVSIIDRNMRVLAHEEAGASAALESSLLIDGVELCLSVNVTQVEYAGGVFALTLDDGRRLEGDALLVAVGRKPNSDALNCAAGGVELDKRGMVAVDMQLRTTAQGVYAIGDVAGQPAFTHVSWEDYRRLKDIVKGGTRTRDDRVLGYTTFTEPHVARVGLTNDQALAKGYDTRMVSIDMEMIARAYEWAETIGFYRLVVDKATDKILGATLVGYEAGEIVHVILAHMEAGSTWHVLDRSVHIHPTFAEGLPTLARQLA